MKAWTDHPFIRLGDMLGKKAPVREIEVLYCNKYKFCRIRVFGSFDEINAKYIYQREGRRGTVPPITQRQVIMLSYNTADKGGMT